MSMNLFESIFDFGLQLTRLTGEQEPVELVLPRKIYDKLFYEITSVRQFNSDKYSQGMDLRIQNHGCDVIVKWKSEP